MGSTLLFLSTSDSTYTLGLTEMLTGSTTNTFKQILADVDLVGGENIGNVILAKIKNTMSDRHIYCGEKLKLIARRVPFFLV